MAFILGRRPPAEEARNVRLQGRDVVYLLKRSPRRKTVALRIDAGGLTVSVPLRVSQGWLDRLLQDKAGWVLQKLDALRAAPSTEWRDGEALPFLGRRLKLCLVPGRVRAPAVLADERLLVGVEDAVEAGRIEARVLDWYRRQALAHFGERLELYARRLGVPLPLMRLSSARTRWGSCNARGEIRLNWRLIKAPPEQIDYVVAHELAHLVEMNHSPAFWATVARIFPDHAAVRRELRRCSPLYSAF